MFFSMQTLPLSLDQKQSYMIHTHEGIQIFIIIAHSFYSRFHLFTYLLPPYNSLKSFKRKRVILCGRHPPSDVHNSPPGTLRWSCAHSHSRTHVLADSCCLLSRNSARMLRNMWACNLNRGIAMVMLPFAQKQISQWQGPDLIPGDTTTGQ